MTDKEIFSVISPKSKVKGPYAIVYKGVQDEWALVTLCWMKHPCLGIRWFSTYPGMPISRANPVWFVIPKELNDVHLDGLHVSGEFRNKINEFLNRRLSGDELYKYYYEHIPHDNTI